MSVCGQPCTARALFVWPLLPRLAQRPLCTAIRGAAKQSTEAATSLARSAARVLRCGPLIRTPADRALPTGGSDSNARCAHRTCLTHPALPRLTLVASSHRSCVLGLSVPLLQHSLLSYDGESTTTERHRCSGTTGCDGHGRAPRRRCCCCCASPTLHFRCGCDGSCIQTPHCSLHRRTPHHPFRRRRCLLRRGCTERQCRSSLRSHSILPDPNSLTIERGG